MRLAVLDIGSSSAQLQVVDLAAGAPPLPAHAVKEPTLLAEAVEICPWALREGILLRHLEQIAEQPALPLQPLTRTPTATVRQLSPASAR